MREWGRSPGQQHRHDQESALLANPVEIQRHLKGVSYPATREDLLEATRSEDAPPEVLESFESLPEGEEFDGPDDVMEALED
jgi:hypothetical protein